MVLLLVTSLSDIDLAVKKSVAFIFCFVFFFTVKPNPPVNLSHIQTIEAELILRWDPPKAETRPLMYEVRYTHNTTDPAWQVKTLAQSSTTAK